MTNTQAPTFIYIVGRGHSGSTMLEILLNRNSKIAAMGEIDMLGLQIYRKEQTRWIGTCSCKSRPENCVIWSKVLSSIKLKHSADIIKSPFCWRISDVTTEEEYGFRRPIAWITYKLHRIIRTFLYTPKKTYNSPFSRLYLRWILNRDEVARAYAHVCGVEAVVDASKDPLQMRDIVAHSELPLKIIYLTRDVRGLAWSAVKKKRHNVIREAREWKKLNSRIIKLLEGVPKSMWHQVRYEDLCSSPSDTLNDIYKFIGLGNNLHTPAEEFEKRHTIAGNQTRFRPLNKIKEDLAWQENLSQQQLNAITNIAGDLAAELGYEI